MANEVATSSYSVLPKSDLPTFSFSGSTAPLNHVALETVSGSSPDKLVRVCTTANSSQWVGMYNTRFGNVNAFNDATQGKLVTPVNGGTDYVLVSGTGVTEAAPFLITAGDTSGSLCSTSGTSNPTVVAKCLEFPATGGQLVAAQIYRAPNPTA